MLQSLKSPSSNVPRMKSISLLQNIASKICPTNSLQDRRTHKKFKKNISLKEQPKDKVTCSLPSFCPYKYKQKKQLTNENSVFRPPPSYITKKVAMIIISVGWAIGCAFAMIPMFWNNWETKTMCEFNEILPLWYVVGVITPAFTLVWMCMLTLYWRIWREASKHAKQLRSSFSGLQDTPPSDWKSVQVTTH